jgi:hypothetical protein
MPRGNGMGPMGMGPMTGRGAGNCAGTSRKVITGRGQGGGGNGSGGRGWRNMFFATGLPGWLRSAADAPTSPGTTSVPGKKDLEVRAEALQAELDAIKKRLEEEGQQ